MVNDIKYLSPDGDDWTVEQRKRHGARTSLAACGGSQLVIGIGGLAVGGASLGIQPSNYQLACGLWAGGLILISGIVALASRKSNSKKSLEASMAFHIIACIVSAPWVWFASTGAGYDYYKYMQTGVLIEDHTILNMLASVMAICSIFVSTAGAVSAKNVRDDILEKGGY